ncbi:uncharacterized protein GGS25DRAFT_4603 [Hypoxylon fragiforme]|uniref:uncharacterized protein n=1 Tax=Hypoxylon fragiforme TaxID=63214 RepID=UPI0020C728DF|nr:uncharacterized protein GGS25DRAFT_4603 [Hypoxylon fragiforme]KAI2613557.1 hypothetical protein GGS25DRAFT_4603 [Hypoxylon fragiforme]
MSVPEPPVSLTGACSAIFNNTLYSFSAGGFESIALEDGAQWKKLPEGHSVDGGVCVGSTPKDDAAAGFFVVGGKSASSSDYTGLQKYTYSTGKWETITPQVTVAQDRQYHSATYINSSDTILMYSGSTDGQPNLSSQTFAIMASEPHSVLAFQSGNSPPAVAPILLPWSETQAAMIGGNPTNTKVMLFDTTNGWGESGVTLAEPLQKSTTIVKGALINGIDGSKHLYTFDLSASPNTVNRTMLLLANGAPLVNAVPATTTAPAKRAVEGRNSPEKRDLTADSWPNYNSTGAPQSTREGYSLATDSNGLVVITGGNDEEPLVMFNAKENGWKDAESVFGQQVFSIQSVPSSTSGLSSSSPSPTPTSTSALSSSAVSSVTSTTQAPSVAPTVASKASDDSDASGSDLPPTTLLGVVLGTIFGFAILLMCLLFWIKHMRKRQNHVEAGQARRDSGVPDEKDLYKPEMAKTSAGHFRGHAQQESAGSFSSMAILMGKVQKPAVQRKTSSESKRSSVSEIFNKQFKSSIGRPQPQEPDVLAQEEKGISFARNANEPKSHSRLEVAQDGTTRRSSGWNRYWSGGSALSIFGFGNSGNASRRETGATEPSSVYTNKNRLTQDSATVPALRVEGRPELNRVHSASPTVAHNPKVGEEMWAQIERPVSVASSSGYSSGIPASVHEDWDPAMVKSNPARAASSVYSQTFFQTASGPARISIPPIDFHTQPPPGVGSTSNDLSWLNLNENKPAS